MGKNSKSKLLKKGIYTPEAVNATVPANSEAEKKESIVKNATNARVFVKGRSISIDDAIKKKKNREDRTRMRRFNRMVAAGMTEEQIKEFEKNSSIRTIMIMPFTNFTFVDGKKTKEVLVRDETHHVTGKKTIEVDNILSGVSAVLAFLKKNNITPICSDTMAVYFNTTKDEVSKMQELIKDVGRIVIHKWLPEEPEEERKLRKPSGNKNKEKTHISSKQEHDLKKMQPYYAVLRKIRKANGKLSDVREYISKRIKDHNPTLAADIEKWVLKREKTLKPALSFKNNSIKHSEEYRAQHRQLTAKEMRARKRAKKVAKHLKNLELMQDRNKKAMIKNRLALQKRIQNATKPVQTELKMAA